MPTKTRSLVTLAATAIALSALAGPVAAEPTDPPEEPVAEFVPELRTEQVWFTCEGQTGVAQLDGASTWTAEPPPDGDGCVSLDNVHHAETEGDSFHDTVFRGSFEGNLDSLTLRMHGFSVPEAETADLAVALTVDGTPAVSWPTEATVTPTDGALEVSVTGIGLLDEADTVPHELAVTLSMAGDSTAGTWRWGSAEEASGITFHPETLAEAVIPAGTSPEPPPAEPTTTLPAGPVIAAGPLAQSTGYLTPQVPMVPNTTLSFGNADQMVHDVTSRARTSDGKPLFRSSYTSPGTTSTVAGAEALPPGTYEFYCSLHPHMAGTLHVVGG